MKRQLQRRHVINRVIALCFFLLYVLLMFWMYAFQQLPGVKVPNCSKIFNNRELQKKTN
jgi:hypothetical protein